MPTTHLRTVPRLLSGRPCGPKRQRLRISIERACRALPSPCTAPLRGWNICDMELCQQTRGHHCVDVFPIRSNSFLRERHAVLQMLFTSLMLFHTPRCCLTLPCSRFTHLIFFHAQTVAGWWVVMIAAAATRAIVVVMAVVVAVGSAPSPSMSSRTLPLPLTSTTYCRNDTRTHTHTHTATPTTRPNQVLLRLPTSHSTTTAFPTPLECSSEAPWTWTRWWVSCAGLCWISRPSARTSQRCYSTSLLGALASL